MKQEKIDLVWRERYLTLNQFFVKMSCLVKMNKPNNQKIAILRKDFDKFVLESFDQDNRIRNIVLEE